MILNFRHQFSSKRDNEYFFTISSWEDDFLEAVERKTAMNYDEMQDYWKTLCSFSGEDISHEISQLMEKIHYPRFLYKYRAVNNNNLDALRSNKLFFSKASSYDDPFDTFLHILSSSLRSYIRQNPLCISAYFSQRVSLNPFSEKQIDKISSCIFERIPFYISMWRRFVKNLSLIIAPLRH